MIGSSGLLWYMNAAKPCPSVSTSSRASCGGGGGVQDQDECIIPRLG